MNTQLPQSLLHTQNPRQSTGIHRSKGQAQECGWQQVPSQYKQECGCKGKWGGRESVSCAGETALDWGEQVLVSLGTRPVQREGST